MCLSRLLLLISLLVPAASLLAQNSQVAATPPMGWNSWNHFAGRVSEKNIRDAADALVSSGMRDAGYIYVNIDDTWQGARDAHGNIQGNARFPDMKALADYVHSKGLKLGLYSSPGPKTCGGYGTSSVYEGSGGHEDQDATTFAEWRIDYLKYDICTLMPEYMNDENAPLPYSKRTLRIMKQAYEKMHLALIATGRPIVYSLCQYGFYYVWEWGPSVGANLWRTTGDIEPNYDRISVIGFSQAGLSKYAGPGHWNDPDMLEIGNGRMTHDENLTHMSLWVILAAPLIAGNDLSHMTPDTLAILTNREAIAIDQDVLGIQGDRISAVGPVEIWDKPLKGGDKAVAIFNRDQSALPVTLKLAAVGFPTGARTRDIWGAKDLGKLRDSYTVEVPRHGVVLLRLSSED
jgi:alpha-galactosidase